jgi:para-nitrobenzyl esterase
MTDLVAAQKWVHNNIESFRGDPDRVMIYGQSGSGSKVTTLMGVPEALGLFHRASAQSGGGGNIPDKEQQQEVARELMKDLGLAERHPVTPKNGVVEAHGRRQCCRCQVNPGW